MSYTVAVENIKCGGCANTIRNKLVEQQLAREVESISNRARCMSKATRSGATRSIAALARMGYP